MKQLQAELNHLLERTYFPIAIVFEGRDSAGKSGAIKRVTEYLPTSRYIVHHSKKPSKSAMKNWLAYWEKKMPKLGQVALFDRSWYSRALVQRVNGWCTEKQALNFIKDVPQWEASHSETLIIKLWLSITEETQRERLNERQVSPLTYWKYSPNDAIALSSYDKMTLAKNDAIDASWHVVDFNNKEFGQCQVLQIICDEISAGLRGTTISGAGNDND